MSDESTPIPVTEESVDRSEIMASRRQRSRRKKLLAGLLLSGFGIIALFSLWYELQVHSSADTKHWVVLEVKPGDGQASLANSLASKKVISQSFAFRLYTTIHSSPALQPGLYAFHPGQSFPQILESLQGPPNASRFTVLPGFTLAEVASRIASIHRVDLAKHFSRAYAHMAVHSKVVPNASTLEGKIGVGEYIIMPGEKAVDLLAQMVQRFDAEARSVGLFTATKVEGQSALQVINVASVVEKEGYYVKNMPQVSRVIYNRLAKGMPLQMDSTVLYSLGQDGGPVTAAMLKIPSPYNSYLHGGLPPTPICTPSVEALRAAVHPVAGSWLFFVVVDKSGTEAFSNSYAEQLRNQDLARKRGL